VVFVNTKHYLWSDSVGDNDCRNDGTPDDVFSVSRLAYFVESRSFALLFDVSSVGRRISCNATPVFKYLPPIYPFKLINTVNPPPPKTGATHNFCRSSEMSTTQPAEEQDQEQDDIREDFLYAGTHISFAWELTG